MDTTPYQLVRAGLLIAAALALIATIFLTIHLHKKKTKIHVLELGISVFAIFLCLGLFTGIAFSGALSYPLFVKTVGPSGTPHLPLSSAFSFLQHMNEFEQIDNIAGSVNIPKSDREQYLNGEIYIPQHREITLTATEVLAEIAPGITVNYWTYDNQVPGPFLRVVEGDTISVHLKNANTSLHTHSLDFHAVNGPGGGASILRAAPGEEATFTFVAKHAGVFVYHCAGGPSHIHKEAYGNSAAVHMAHGQYGLILVEPKEGLSEVDREFYVMQGEIYTTGRMGDKGLQAFDTARMLNGVPTYVVFNGKVGGTQIHAEQNETIRLYVGNGGVNLVSSFHVIGEVFDVVYPEGSLREKHTGVQSTLVPAGGSAVVEFFIDEPGKYVLVDHALARTEKGAYSILTTSGINESSGMTH